MPSARYGEPRRVPLRARRVGIRLAGLLGLLLLPSCGGEPGPSVRVVIPRGASMRVAAESLASAGVIRMPAAFRVYASVRRQDRTIRAGTYLLPQRSAWGDVLDALGKGKGLVRGMTIPEGWALRQIVPQLARVLGVPRESVTAVVRDTALLRRLDVPAPTLEGYLFPDTYTFPEGTTPRVAVGLMVQRFEEGWRPAWNARLQELAMSRHDILTLASIVEREAIKPEERPVIAAVYMNRLREGMLLQADPTVQYALPEWKSRVLLRDLKVESPYNTYRHKGLPPGPIGSPGAPSIIAALFPADVPFKFFVAFPDGHHEFRRTFAEHTVAKRAARAAWGAYAARRAAARALAARDSARLAAPAGATPPELPAAVADTSRTTPPGLR